MCKNEIWKTKKIRKTKATHSGISPILLCVECSQRCSPWTKFRAFRTMTVAKSKPLVYLTHILNPLTLLIMITHLRYLGRTHLKSFT